MTRLRILLVAVLLLLPLPALAGPITFAFTAGPMTGQYTFERATPGVRQFSTDPTLDEFERVGGLRFTGAITNFIVQVGTFTATGTTGDIEIGVNRRQFGETFYIADMRTPPTLNLRLLLDFSNFAGDNFITAEALSDVAPNPFSVEGTARSASLFEDIPGHPRVIAESQDLTIRRVGGPVNVPEPTTALLFGMGLLGAAAHRRFPKPRGRRM